MVSGRYDRLTCHISYSFSIGQVEYGCDHILFAGGLSPFPIGEPEGALQSNIVQVQGSGSRSHGMSNHHSSWGSNGRNADVAEDG